jgi:hypothetical protein
MAGFSAGFPKGPEHNVSLCETVRQNGGPTRTLPSQISKGKVLRITPFASGCCTAAARITNTFNHIINIAHVHIYTHSQLSVHSYLFPLVPVYTSISSHSYLSTLTFSTLPSHSYTSSHPYLLFIPIPAVHSHTRSLAYQLSALIPIRIYICSHCVCSRWHLFTLAYVPI